MKDTASQTDPVCFHCGANQWLLDLSSAQPGAPSQPLVVLRRCACARFWFCDDGASTCHNHSLRRHPPCEAP